MAHLTGAAIRGFVALLGLFSLGGQRRLARGLAAAIRLLRVDAVRVTRINVDACFPELDLEQRRSLVRESLANSVMLLTELGTLCRLRPSAWRQLAVAVEGEHLMQQARAAGNGVLVLVPHLGNWEFLSLVLGEQGVTALYDPPRQRALEPLIHAIRGRGGAAMLPIDARGLRGFYQALARGGVAALLPDQVPERSAGVHADFFGRPALTMTFAHRLLRRTRARVLMAVAVRRPGGFVVRYIDPGPALATPEPSAGVAAMNAAIERLVRADPAQYQWEYKRFKRPPPGTDDIYARR